MRLLNSSIWATIWSVYFFAEPVFEVHIFFVHFFQKLEAELLILKQLLFSVQFLFTRTFRNTLNFLDLASFACASPSESLFVADPVKFDWIWAKIFGQKVLYPFEENVLAEGVEVENPVDVLDGRKELQQHIQCLFIPELEHQRNNQRLRE